jgi:hypothetical protein
VAVLRGRVYRFILYAETVKVDVGLTQWPYPPRNLTAHNFVFLTNVPLFVLDCSFVLINSEFAHLFLVSHYPF